MPHQPTIKDSFRKRLHHPSITVVRAQGGYRGISVSSKTTRETPPLMSLRRRDPRLLTQMTLDKLAAMQPPLEGYVPQLEQSHHLSHEADIARVVDLYLLNPVLITVQRLIGTQGELICKPEAYTRPGRVDFRFSYTAAGSNAIDVAAIELKATDVIRYSDWATAFANANAVQQRNEASLRRPMTLLKHNAIVLSQQVRMYADTIHVPHVALFDWDSMLVFDFTGIDESEATFAKACFLDESSQEDTNSGVTFRSLLAGFLINALQSKGISL